MPRKPRPIGRTIERLERRWLLAAVGNNLAVGDQYLEYRIAIASTAEYTSAVGGTAAALDSIENLVDSLNSLYESELAIHFDLVSGTNLIFTDPATDGYTNSSPSSMLSENHNKLTSVLGTDNFDIGHVLGGRQSGASGIATLGIVGHPLYKGRGVSVVSGDALAWLDVVAHEIGHQFGAEHSFNGTDGNCSGNRSANSAYEPGSGSTMMSYFGICSSDNLPAPESFAFHAASFEDIHTYIASNNHAQPYSTTPINNQIPTVSAGSDNTIPAHTPFELTAAGSDANTADQLTYSWEELDLGSGQSIGTGWADNGSSPLFRVYPPTTQATRTFPRMSDLLDNVDTSPLGELLPSTNRDLNFRVTVRDGRGGVHSDDVLLRVRDTGSPFRVTSPNTSVAWMGGAIETVTWDVAGTTDNGINAQSVQIFLSTDGGASFPHLVTTTANDGSASIVVPNLESTDARLMIKGAGNVFFDVSDQDFTINRNLSNAGLTITPSAGWGELVEGGASRTYSVQLNTDPEGTVEVQVNADAETEISQDGVSYANTQTLLFHSTDPQTVWARAIGDQETEGPWQSSLLHEVVGGTSPNYVPGMIGDILTVFVTDLQSPPVIGIDFDSSSPQFVSTPSGWTGTYLGETGTSPYVFTNLPRDDGLPTTVDLTVDFAFAINGTGSHSADATASSKPMHLPSLQAIGGYNFLPFALPMIATWSDLIPNAAYGVHVLGLQDLDEGTLEQSVQIVGAPGSSAAFNQSLTEGVLNINDEIGDSARSLESFEEVIVADANGEITITIDALDGDIALAGLALRAIPQSAAEVVGRYLFYNNSSFDGNDPSVNADDDNAIATDKAPLRTGSANSAHYSTFVSGINGIMIDIANTAGTLTADDFQFRMGTDGDPGLWSESPPDPAVTVRPGAGVNQSDRVSLTWPDATIQDTWLQVTVQSNASTGLSSPDVFYFGNLVGDTLNATSAQVDMADMQRIFPMLFNTADIASTVDINRDQTVSFEDLQTVFDRLFHSLPLIQIPANAVTVSGSPIVDEPGQLTPNDVDQVFASDLLSDGNDEGEPTPEIVVPIDVIDQWDDARQPANRPQAVAWVA